MLEVLKVMKYLANSINKMVILINDDARDIDYILNLVVAYYDLLVIYLVDGGWKCVLFHHQCRAKFNRYSLNNNHEQLIKRSYLATV